MDEIPIRWIRVEGRDGANAQLAARFRPGNGTPLIWLGGFRSDMSSIKAVAIDAWARDHGRPCLRFDYSAHGQTGGRFEDMTISVWLEDALAALSTLDEPAILVGSSMGAWIALLAARARENCGEPPLAGLVLIAPAVDFTESLMWAALSDAARRDIMEAGVHHLPSTYGDAYPITRALIEDGRKHLLLGGLIDPGAQVHILQGFQDPDVPWKHAMALVDCLPSTNCRITFVKDGDHRLSRPADIDLLRRAIEGMGA